MILNLLGDNSYLGIAAVGMTFVIVSGGIDLSVGAVMGLATVVVASLIGRAGLGAPGAYVAAVCAGAVVGCASGCLIEYAGLRPFIATLAMMFMARGIAFLLSLEAMPIENALHTRLAMWAVRFGDGGAALALPAIVLLVVVAAGSFGGALVPLGRYVYAIGGAEEAARMIGLPVARTKVAVYALSGACASLGGVVLTLYSPSGDATAGTGLELDAIAAAVVGGTLLTGGVGSAMGTLVGVLTIGLITTIVKDNEGLSSGWTRVATGCLLLLFVGLQRGLARWVSRAEGAL
jgi:simple sugar transport system permease protein